jgi:hypothetical protein
MTVPNERADVFKEMIRDAGLHFHSVQIGSSHTSVYMFRFQYLRHVIARVVGEVRDDPDVVYKAWCMGKLFGYSDSEIGSYIRRLASGPDYGCGRR